MCNLNYKGIQAGVNTFFSTHNIYKTNKEINLHKIALIYKHCTHLKVQFFILC